MLPRVNIFQLIAHHYIGFMQDKKMRVYSNIFEFPQRLLALLTKLQIQQFKTVKFINMFLVRHNLREFIVDLAQDEHIRTTLLHKSEPFIKITRVVHKHFELKYLQLGLFFSSFRIYRDNQTPKSTIHNDRKTT